VRNLLVQKDVDEARREVEKLEKAYPQHRAAKRARGELFRATAIGKPFGFTLKSPDGTTLDTAAYKGKVLVIHFWSNTNPRAVDSLGTLRALHKLHADEGLALVGINLDMDRTIFEQSRKRLNLPWPQYYEPGGMTGNLVVGLGVIRIPSYYVVDRRGVLRYTEPGVRLPQLVEGLLSTAATER